jgi:hypothetical protein
MIDLSSDSGASTPSEDESGPMAETSAVNLDENTADDVASLSNDIDTEADDHAEELAEVRSYEELQKMMTTRLKSARSKGLTREINICAALRDFYKVAGELGRIRSSEQVAISQGKGPSYARALRAHARYFERNLELQKTKQQLSVKMSGILGDESVRSEVKMWLRTLKPGTVRESHYGRSTLTIDR